MSGTSIVRPHKLRERVETISILTEGATDAIYMGGLLAGEWIKRVKEPDKLAYVRSFAVETVTAYWRKAHRSGKPLPPFFQKETLPVLDETRARLAIGIGEAAEVLGEMEAIYELGNVYTSLLPEANRTKAGVFYTPPPLTSRLLDMAETAGVNWATARVIDPACGGGAFLAPVCARKIPHLHGLKPTEIIEHIESHLTGWDIDPFGAWLSQVFVEILLRNILDEAAVNMKSLVRVCNSLETPLEGMNEKFDLVIGNPPYGKVKSTPAIRTRYKESLYGHPNLYGLFTHLATELAAINGIVALVTPTSFLSGEYFKHLRRLLRNRVQPIEMDFVDVRKGVFDGVLQETMLTTYQRKRSPVDKVKINELKTPRSGGVLHVPIGTVTLPEEFTAPWIIARSPNQITAMSAMRSMPARLKDWGYTVSTGPLVWNRHKTQLKKRMGKDNLPVIWAESIRQDGTFEFRAEKSNHQPYFELMKGDDWLVIRKPCILLQRTTAKEQEKRLVAASLPASFARRGVVIENHLNMILPSNGKPLVDPELLSVFLNSKAANKAFKTISGSVAVSAYELEAFPLPDPASLKELAGAIKNGLSKEKVEDICSQLYSIPQ
jgi:adenine-specific DNA-methyltransferase